MFYLPVFLFIASALQQASMAVQDELHFKRRILQENNFNSTKSESKSKSKNSDSKSKSKSMDTNSTKYNYN